MTTPDSRSAQSHAVKQPAVVGYPNEKGVTIERVTYPARNSGTAIVGNLFKPPEVAKLTAFFSQHLSGGGAANAPSPPRAVRTIRL